MTLFRALFDFSFKALERRAKGHGAEGKRPPEWRSAVSEKKKGRPEKSFFMTF
ncbi:hypothetical protein SD77_0775 [Bacillus badius]|uniref:Ribose 5-phosphate isomerase B n=1 Tax=Bacillus badius TaxID=1455 RepID=A0ABR5AU50_BACBA|nr:hypothetical protein SD78_3979 [Bacillus badius]KIL78174.1 hypothetical protein SD77_0775 [Bacillus badius]